MNQFKIVQGQLPTLKATLVDTAGQPLDLTDCTVDFSFVLAGGGVMYSGAGTIDADPTTGKVTYVFTSGQTATVGNYTGQWLVTDAGDVTVSYPFGGCGVPFQIIPNAPVPAPTEFTLLSDLYDDVRALTGDFHRRLYTDGAIASVMRVQLRMGRIRTDCPEKVWTLGADNISISPAIENTDVQAYALLAYHTAHQLVLPNVPGYRYRTRAMSEQFGEQKDFLFNLQNVLYELEDGGQTHANVTGLRNWLFLVNGIWVWSLTELENTVEVSFH
jgi:hypothetical protein